MSKSIYGLTFNLDSGPVIFYIGCTDNVKRRTGEHNNNPFNPKHAEYMTYKYQWCRHLRNSGIDYRLEVLVDGIDTDDENSEYEWVLKFARYNQDRGIHFIDNQPLTNMKAGDFFEEMMSDKNINTAKEISAYRQRKIQQQQQQREINYQRDNTFGDQSNSMFGKLFTPDKLQQMRVPAKTRKQSTGYNHTEARQKWLEQETQAMIDRDRAEGRELPGGISDEKS